MELSPKSRNGHEDGRTATIEIDDKGRQGLGKEQVEGSVHRNALSQPTFHTVSDRKVGKVSILVIDFDEFDNALGRVTHGTKARHDTLGSEEKRYTKNNGCEAVDNLQTAPQQRQPQHTITYCPVDPEV